MPWKRPASTGRLRNLPQDRPFTHIPGPKLASEAIAFLDQHSHKVLDRGGHPFSQWLEMRDTIQGLDIWFRVQQSGYSNGSSAVKVRHHGELVLFAVGDGFYAPSSMVVSVFRPGRWIDILQKTPR